MKAIVIGDCHSTPSSKEEVEKLLRWAYNLALQNKCEDIILLGDLFDTHQYINLDVVYSYFQIFASCNQITWVAIPGNHDHSVHGQRLEHALLPFKILPNVKIFDAPDGKIQNYKGIDFAPFCRTEEEFLQLCKEPTSDLLICHQEFAGAEYDNGFFAPNGTDLNKVPYTSIISGHIHKQQQIGKCFYLGAPRWFKTTDANQSKVIALLENKKIIKTFDTSAVCRSIIKISLTNDQPMPKLSPGIRYIIEAKGIPSYLEKVHDLFLGKAEVRGLVEYKRDVSVKESVGIEKALEDFVKNQYKLNYLEDREYFLQRLQKDLYEYR